MILKTIFDSTTLDVADSLDIDGDLSLELDTGTGEGCDFYLPRRSVEELYDHLSTILEHP